MKTFFFAIIVMLSACSSPDNNSEVFKVNGEALRGYDAVAFYTVQKPVKGRADYKYTWKNATWLFDNQANLDSFRADPEKYAPQYGGYCAYGTADNHKAPTEIETYTLQNGKLYFNYNKEVQQLWNRERENYIKRADSLWPQVKDDAF